MIPMTTPQRLLLFIDSRRGLSLWTQICRVKGWDKNDRKLRMDWCSSVLCRPITSSTEIGKLDDVDDLIGEAMAIIRPDDLGAQLRQANMRRTRLIYRIKNSFEEGTILGLLCSARFKRKSMADLEEMSVVDLTHLRDTLCGRQAGWQAVKTPEPVPVAAGHDEDPF